MKRLVSFKAFADRLGVCVRTLERMYEVGDHPQLPSVIWVLRRRYFDEAETDAFIASVIRNGMPGKKPFTPAGAAAKAQIKRRAKDFEAA